MPSGQTHSALSTLALVAVPVALAIWTQVPVAPVVCGLLAGLLVTPDLDLPGRTHEERRRFIGPVLRVLFWPYAKRGKHRDWRHWPLVGTAARILYLAIPTWLVGRWLDVAWPIIEPRYLWWALGGWAFQDALHWLADWVHSMMIRVF